jgi:type I restriction enzyme S subunit
VDLANTKNGYINEIKHFGWEEAPARARRVLTYGDTIVGTVRPGNNSFAFIGKTEQILTGSTGFAVLTPKKNDYREFIYLIGAGNANIERLSHLADGAAYPAVRPDVVTAIECVVPEHTIIKKFSTIVAPIFDKIDYNNITQLVLSQLRDTLLPKLLSGEISLNDAESIIKGGV